MIDPTEKTMKPSDSILHRVNATREPNQRTLTLAGGWEPGDTQSVVIAMLRDLDEHQAAQSAPPEPAPGSRESARESAFSEANKAKAWASALADLETKGVDVAEFLKRGAAAIQKYAAPIAEPPAPSDPQPFEPMACCGRERDKDGGPNPHCECPAPIKPKHAESPAPEAGEPADTTCRDWLDGLLDSLSDGLTLEEDGVLLGEDAGLLIESAVKDQLANVEKERDEALARGEQLRTDYIKLAESLQGDAARQEAKRLGGELNIKTIHNARLLMEVKQMEDSNARLHVQLTKDRDAILQSEEELEKLNAALVAQKQCTQCLAKLEPPLATAERPIVLLSTWRHPMFGERQVVGIDDNGARHVKIDGLGLSSKWILMRDFTKNWTHVSDPPAPQELPADTNHELRVASQVAAGAAGLAKLYSNGDKS